MGIESTAYITREEAIDRIREIANLISSARLGYRVMRVDVGEEEICREIEEDSGEYDYDVQEFVDDWEPIDTSGLENWTDEMLGDYMDKPFFRYSMFSNYLIEKEE